MFTYNNNLAHNWVIFFQTIIQATIIYSNSHKHDSNRLNRLSNWSQPMSHYSFRLLMPFFHPSCFLLFNSLATVGFTSKNKKKRAIISFDLSKFKFGGYMEWLQWVVWSGCIALKIDEEHNHDTRVFDSQWTVKVVGNEEAPNFCLEKGVGGWNFWVCFIRREELVNWHCKLVIQWISSLATT